jgi:hypothetical protein
MHLNLRQKVKFEESQMITGLIFTARNKRNE